MNDIYISFVFWLFEMNSSHQMTYRHSDNLLLFVVFLFSFCTALTFWILLCTSYQFDPDDRWFPKSLEWLMGMNLKYLLSFPCLPSCLYRVDRTKSTVCTADTGRVVSRTSMGPSMWRAIIDASARMACNSNSATTRTDCAHPSGSSRDIQHNQDNRRASMLTLTFGMRETGSALDYAKNNHCIFRPAGNWNWCIYL